MRIFIKSIVMLGLLATSWAASAQQPIILGGENQIILDVDLHPEGKQLAATQDNEVVIWDVESMKSLQKLTNGHDKRVMAVDYDHSGNWLVSGGKDGKVIIWDLRSGRKSAAFESNGLVTAVKFHPGREMVAAAIADGRVVVWNISSGEMVYNLTAHQGDVTCIDFSHDGTLLASGGADHTIALWNVTSGEIIKRLQKHKNWVREISFNEDGQSLASVSDDSKLIIWSVSDLQNIRANIEHSLTGGDWLLCANYTSGNTITLGSRKGQLSVKTKFGNYKYSVGVPIHDVVLVPNVAHRVVALAATHGKGLILIDAGLMKFRQK